MTILVFFDAYASSYEIKSELGGVLNAQGVASSSLMLRAEGDGLPAYCVKLDVDDSAAAAVMERVKNTAAQYAGYASNVKIVGYKTA